MNDRYEITFKEGGVDAFETIITGGLAKVTEKALDTITGDDSHGWYCQIIDTKTNLKVSYWGVTKAEAQEKAFKELNRKIKEFEYEQEKEYERQQLKKQEKRQAYSQSSSSTSFDDDGIRAIFFYMKWGIIIGAALFIIIIAFFLAPLGLLIWYLIDKRKTQWIAIVGMLFAAYFVYDISSGGFITSNMKNTVRTGEEKYIALGYFTILVTTLGFFLDKYSLTKIPVVKTGNFFTKKDIKERRPLIASLSIFLLTIFSIFNFVDFSSKKTTNYQKPEYQNTNSTKSVENVKTNNKSNNYIVKNSEDNNQNTSDNLNRSSDTNLNGKFPIASTKLLTHDELKSYSKYDLKIMRNEIFARHGYIFRKGGEMEKYFKQTDWYIGKYTNVNNLLTDIELRNIKLIQQYEQ